MRSRFGERFLFINFSYTYIYKISRRRKKNKKERKAKTFIYRYVWWSGMDCEWKKKQNMSKMWKTMQ